MKGPNMYDPTNPDEHADLDPVAAVVAAWTAEWPDKHWQEDSIQYLRDIFPALTAALDRLVASREPEEAPRPELSGRQEVFGFKLPAAPVTTQMLDTLHRITSTVPPVEFSVPFEDEPEPEPELEASQLEPLDDFDPDDKTIDEVKERARVATTRIQAWGRQRSLEKSVFHERELRLKLVVWLNNRTDVTQREIAEAIGVSVGRVTQLIAEHYNRVDYELKLPKRRRSSVPKV